MLILYPQLPAFICSLCYPSKIRGEPARHEPQSDRRAYSQGEAGIPGDDERMEDD